MCSTPPLCRCQNVGPVVPNLRFGTTGSPGLRLDFPETLHHPLVCWYHFTQLVGMKRAPRSVRHGRVTLFLFQTRPVRRSPWRAATQPGGVLGHLRWPSHPRSGGLGGGRDHHALRVATGRTSGSFFGGVRTQQGATVTAGCSRGCRPARVVFWGSEKHLVGR